MLVVLAALGATLFAFVLICILSRRKSAKDQASEFVKSWKPTRIFDRRD